MEFLRRYGDFRRLWIASAISLIGDWFSFVAVSMLALDAGGGALGLAMVFAVHALPGALLSPFAGMLVDRFDRRRVLVAADLACGLLTAAMVAAAVGGWLAAVQLLLLVRSGVNSLVLPAESAAVRRVVPAGELIAANALLAATWSIAYVLGMGLGGAAALLGPVLALVLDTASFLVAAAVHATLPAMPVADAPRSRWFDVVRETPRDTAIAIKVAAGSRPLLTAVFGKMPLGLAAGAGWVALNVIGTSAKPFGAAALSFGVLQAIRGLGMGIGPAVAARLVERGADERRLQHAACATMLAAVAALSLVRDPLGLSVVALIWGIGTGTNWVMSHTAIQRHASDAVIGRLAAFDELLVTTAMVMSAFVGGAVADEYDAGTATVVGAACGVVGLFATRVMIGRVTAPIVTR